MVLLASLTASVLVPLVLYGDFSEQGTSGYAYGDDEGCRVFFSAILRVSGTGTGTFIPSIPVSGERWRFM